MTVLVTGATGFIGSWIARALLDQGLRVRAAARPGSDRFRLHGVAERIEWTATDVFDPTADLAPACRDVDLCVHSAWYAVPGKYLEAHENLACVQGSLRLLEAAAAAGCRRFVGVGTCFEYDFDYGWLSERTPVRPASLYASAKAATRMMSEQLARGCGMAFCWARPFYQYGPWEDTRRLVPHVIESLARGEAVAMTQGLQVRDYLHVQDVGSAIAAIATSSLTGPVNVGSNRPVRVRDVALAIAAQMGRPELLRFGARPENPADPPFICADNRLLLAGTGWTPRFDLETGLADTIAWWRDRHAAAV